MDAALIFLTSIYCFCARPCTLIPRFYTDGRDERRETQELRGGETSPHYAISPKRMARARHLIQVAHEVYNHHPRYEAAIIADGRDCRRLSNMANWMPI